MIVTIKDNIYHTFLVRAWGKTFVVPHDTRFLFLHRSGDSLYVAASYDRPFYDDGTDSYCLDYEEDPLTFICSIEDNDQIDVKESITFVKQTKTFEEGC